MQLYWSIPHTFCVMTFDLRGQIEAKIKIQNSNNEYEKSAYSLNTIRDNFTKFYMQLYWSIPHIFYLMTFDLRGHIRSLRLKQKYVGPSKLTWENEAYSSKTNRDNFTKFYMQLY